MPILPPDAASPLATPPLAAFLVLGIFNNQNVSAIEYILKRRVC